MYGHHSGGFYGYTHLTGGQRGDGAAGSLTAGSGPPAPPAAPHPHPPTHASHPNPAFAGRWLARGPG